MHDLTVLPFLSALKNLSAILTKAEAHAQANKYDVGVLLTSRLYPDQFHLIRQVQAASDVAKACASRLAGKDIPSFADTETTVAQLQERIAKTISHLETFSQKDFDGAETRKITLPIAPGKYLLGREYVVTHAIPNFYFHYTTAYAILRHNGVPVGKRDYLGTLPFKDA